MVGDLRWLASYPGELSCKLLLVASYAKQKELVIKSRLTEELVKYVPDSNLLINKLEQTQNVLYI